MSGEVEFESSSAVATLCGDVLDYAGTFPPAKLGLSEAIERYRQYRSGDDAWMLNRFLVRARDLPAFEKARTEHAPTDTPWPLSVACSDAEDVERACAWRSELATVESLEVKTLAAIPDIGCELFVELPLGVSRGELEALHRRGAMLKIRLGGEPTPTAAAVARILSVCAELQLPLKATAGLHHAIRSDTHGFLNLVLAATLAHQGGDRCEPESAALEALLDETDTTALGFTADSITWREHRFGAAAISDARRLFRSFGSCSFEEPLESLEALGLRP